MMPSKRNVRGNNNALLNLLTEYRCFLEHIDFAFTDFQERNPDIVPCHAGCSRCCAALFAVKPIDAALTALGLISRYPDSADSVRDKCFQIVSGLNDRFGNFSIPFRVEFFGWREFQKVVETYSEPCPFLSSRGLCGIYQYRPRICRLAGVVFRDIASGTLLPDFCPLAESSRMKRPVTPPEYDLTGMDITVAEFEITFRKSVGAAVPSGFTFLAAGILEFRDIFK